MKIEPAHIYHIYNQGNNKATLFFDNADYDQFLTMLKKLVYPVSKILAYCIMPNHFHFLVQATEISAKYKQIGKVESSELSNAFRILQSAYAQYINKKYKRSGSLFRQKAKAKNIDDGDENYLFTAFQYIHQNPINAGLVSKIEDWPYSSFNDYAGSVNKSICDILLAEKLIGYNKNIFLWESYQFIRETEAQNIFLKRDFIVFNGMRSDR